MLLFTQVDKELKLILINNIIKEFEFERGPLGLIYKC